MKKIEILFSIEITTKRWEKMMWLLVAEAIVAYATKEAIDRLMKD